jgi:riboflavin kinase/FMN adenylyltransferase
MSRQGQNTAVGAGVGAVGGALLTVTNVGVRPTFDGAHFTVESHLFDFTQELTSGPMEVRFWKRLRDEKKFSGPAELRAQIDRDLGRARVFFARLGRAKSGNVRPPSHLTSG